MGRKILAVIVGFIVASAIFIIVQMGNSIVMAPPSAEVMADRAKLAEYMASGPTTAYIVVLIGYIIGSFAGGFVATKMGRRWSPGATLAIIVGSLLTLAMIANIMMLPGQPLWFIVASLLLFIPVTLIGYRFAR
jgi:MFS family permease